MWGLVVALLASCVAAAPTVPPASALPHEAPELEARLPSTWSGTPLLHTSYDGEFALGNEDLYGGPFAVLATELVPESGTPSPDLARLQVAEAWVEPNHGHEETVIAFRLPNASSSRWTRIMRVLEDDPPASLRWTYRPTEIGARPALTGTPRDPGGGASIVLASGDTLYEIDAPSLASASEVAAALP